MSKRKLKIVNGVPIDVLLHTAHRIGKSPSLAKIKFHINNKWVGGGLNRTTITSFNSAGKEVFHKKIFTLQSDELESLAGNDIAPNPMEHLLNALAGCLTTSLVYHAAVKGINIYDLQSEIEGEFDLRGYLGLSNRVRKGFQKIKVLFKIDTDSKDIELLKFLSQFSPVFDVVNHGTPMEIRIEKK